MNPILGLTAPAPQIDEGHRRACHEAGIWIDRLGAEIPVQTMTDRCLLGVMAHLYRLVRREARRNRRFYLMALPPQEDMAREAFDEEWDYWVQNDDEEQIYDGLQHQPIYEHLMDELIRRDLWRGTAEQTLKEERR